MAFPRGPDELGSRWCPAAFPAITGRLITEGSASVEVAAINFPADGTPNLRCRSKAPETEGGAG